jgi:2-polyprenyl-3-methyl-5-hydroxy-6-metoxy-1,4-benzoquinol methylase
MNNKIFNVLTDLEIIDSKSVTKFYPNVRDRNDVEVLRCEKSGVIFLSSTETNEIYYKEKEGTSYWSHTNRSEALKSTYEDDKRRFNQFKNIIVNKKYLDFGTGLGGILNLLKPYASEIFAIELQKDIRDLLNTLDYKVFESIDLIPEKQKLDIVSLFHVFEHLTEPLDILRKLHNKLEYNGKIIIEVPHANDALISSFNLDSFKKFTFWSEHLILHTRNSLNIFLKEAGFKNISIKGFQRYPLANHLYWLSKGQSGGHQHFQQFRNKSLDLEYSNLLKNLDQTDTLIAIAEK